MDSLTKGNITTAVVLAELLKSGRNVLIPFGDTKDYDLVLEENKIFKKVQCKTGRYKKGVIKFNLYSVVRNKNTKKWEHKNYGKKVDYYGVYCSELRKTYLIPVLELSNSEGVLRVEESKRKSKKYRMANKYEL